MVRMTAATGLTSPGTSADTTSARGTMGDVTRSVSHQRPELKILRLVHHDVKFPCNSRSVWTPETVTTASVGQASDL